MENIKHVALSIKGTQYRGGDTVSVTFVDEDSAKQFIELIHSFYDTVAESHFTPEQEEVLEQVVDTLVRLDELRDTLATKFKNIVREIKR